MKSRVAANPLQDNIADRIARQLSEDGAAVLPGVFGAGEIARARQTILQNEALMANTRPNPHARHLAGFHQVPGLEPLHQMLTQSPETQRLVQGICGAQARLIGLTDITINRSQHWHKDLLRGVYRKYLPMDRPCAEGHGTVFKVLLYLQDSNSLKFVPGSQRLDIALQSDDCAVPTADTPVKVLPVRAGDVVIIDICTTHRGSREAELAQATLDENAKILLSTVYGRERSPLTDAMEAGNAVRQADWARQHLRATA